MNTLSPITSNPRYEANDHAHELMAQIPENFIETFRIKHSEVVLDGIMILGNQDNYPHTMISFRASSRTIVSCHFDESNPVWIKSVEIVEIGKFSIWMDMSTSGSFPICTCVMW